MELAFLNLFLILINALMFKIIAIVLLVHQAERELEKYGVHMKSDKTPENIEQERGIKTHN